MNVRMKFFVADSIFVGISFCNHKNLFHMILGQEYPAAANYVEINLTAENWTKIIHFVYMKVILHVNMIPKAILSFYLYFATDFGNDAFQLPFAVW